MLQIDLPGVAERFLRYVSIDTTADPTSPKTPSSTGQRVLGALLAEELCDMGVSDVLHDEWGYVYATIPGRNAAQGAVPVALFAHLDTSPDAPGEGVKPIVHPPFDGHPVSLPGNPDIVLDPNERPALLRFVGQNLITSDGTTLLGSDDKAGVAIMMQLAEDCLTDAPIDRPEVRLVFTVDEEIGRGVDKIDLDRVGAKIGYTLDGSDVDVIYTDTFNAARATVTFTGRMVHPGYAEGIMLNAATAAASFVDHLPDERPENTSGDAGFYYVRSIDAPSSDSARVSLLLRDFSKQGMRQRKRTVETIAATLREQIPGLAIDVAIVDEYENIREHIERVTSERSHMHSTRHPALGSRSGKAGSEVERTGLDSLPWGFQRPTYSTAGMTTTAYTNGIRCSVLSGHCNSRRCFLADGRLDSQRAHDPRTANKKGGSQKRAPYIIDASYSTTR